ncbi:hypothetical protein BBJ29_003482 [Phytophthora kernoviae]|uniref:Uncharacterized protein n=1 Tax=Phytophthora kernoviae TaxID=325452 RepID=A0A3F2S1Z9_9STRA|nr:hypothetical protein BBJ29_003482 [Phytophthora kernoviae]RLN68741.1 hypothetical protein BBP00_00000794 [Phytophthora kernoviae]
METVKIVMAARVQLHGEGVSALRTFLSSHLDGNQLSQDKVKKLLLADSKDVLTTAEFRLATTLLGGLRASDPEIPSLKTLLGPGIQVRAVTQEDEEEDAQEIEKRAKYLAKRREKLQRIDQEMRYGNMVRNIKAQSLTAEMTHHQASVKQHLSIGANMVMARITAFIAVYFVARNLTENETARMIAGLGGAIVMMVIEMVLFITRAAKMEALEHDQMKHKSVF